MIRRWALLVLLALGLVTQASAASVNISIGIKASPPQPPSTSQKWSTFSPPVVADGGITNNLTALNAIDPVANPVVQGDCPGGQDIVWDGRWLLKTNFTLNLDPGCRLRATCNAAIASPMAFIEQADLTSAISNVTITGFNYRQTAQCLNKVRVFRLFVNNWTLTNTSIDTYDGLAVIRGDDHTIRYLYALNGAVATGNEGWRIVGGNRHRIRDCTIFSGDGALQVSPVADITSIFFNLSVDDVIYERCDGHAANAESILVGIANQPSNVDVLTSSLSNLIFRNITGSGKGKSLQVLTGNTTGTISNVELTDITMDASADTTQNAAVLIGVNPVWPSTSSLSNLTATRVTVTNPYERAMTITGNTTGVLIDQANLGQPRTGALATLSIVGTSGTTVQNSTIVATTAGIAMGALSGTVNQNLVHDPVITGNTISNVGEFRAGIASNNVEGGLITGNTITSTAGGRGMSFLVAPGDGNNGTTGTTATGNTVGSLVVVCATGQGNTVTGNPSAADCAP